MVVPGEEGVVRLEKGRTEGTGNETSRHTDTVQTNIDIYEDGEGDRSTEPLRVVCGPVEGETWGSWSMTKTRLYSDPLSNTLTRLQKMRSGQRSS